MPDKEKKKEQKIPKFYSHLTMEQKRKFRGQLEAIIENKKKQLAIFEDNFIKPIKEQIALADRVKKNDISIEYYAILNAKWTDWLQKFMGKVSDGIKNEKGKDKADS